MALRLRMHTALPEDLSSGPSTHIQVVVTTTCSDPSSMGFHYLFRKLHSCVHIHRDTSAHIHRYTRTIKSNFKTTLKKGCVGTKDPIAWMRRQRSSVAREPAVWGRGTAPLLPPSVFSVYAVQAQLLHSSLKHSLRLTLCQARCQEPEKQR